MESPKVMELKGINMTLMLSGTLWAIPTVPGVGRKGKTRELWLTI